MSGRYGRYDGSLGDDNIRVMCPVCYGEYSHIREVFSRLGTDPLEGAHPFKGTKGKGVALDWRRPALVIVYEGECGHNWEHIIQQHKGVNYLFDVVTKGEGDD